MAITMTPLATLLDGFRSSSVTEREKGTYFEELIVAYLRNEAVYRDLYSDVWTYADWAGLQGLDKRDTGIDLVAKTSGTGEFHAIQCKFYAEDYRMQKSDIDSFFTETISKEDLLYYVYGPLHSPDYRERYADNPSKELPRIPCVKTAADFWAFSKAGRGVEELHLNYETVAPYPVKIDFGGGRGDRPVAPTSSTANRRWTFVVERQCVRPTKRAVSSTTPTTG